MALVKAPRTLLASQVLGPGAAINAAELDMTLRASARIFVKITNGGSAPTNAPTVQFFVGEAAGVKRDHFTGYGDTANGSITHISARYGMADMFGNVTITNGATNPITVEVYASDVTI